MKRIYLILLALVCVVSADAQVLGRLSGRVTDRDMNPIVGAIVTLKELPQKGSATDIDGRYAISVEEGEYTIEVKYIGYEPCEKRVSIQKKRVVDLIIEQSATDIDQVVVSMTSSAAKLQSVQIGVEQVDIKALSMTPALFGENDIIKSLTLLPGVKSEGDGSSGFQVRGGTSSQNLILLDDASIYNSGHIMGIFSVFNDDALSSAALYKGQIPAMYGGATSAVLDIQSRAGNYDTFEAGFDIGLLSSKAYLETPIVDDRLSLFVGGRRSYFDLFLVFSDEFRGNSLYFYDFNAKLNYRASEDDFVTLSYFKGQDTMSLQDMMDMGWGNDALSAKWFHRFNNRFSASTSLIATRYGTENGIDVADIYCAFNGYIRNLSLKENFEYTADNHTLHFGAQSTWIDLLSAEWQFNDYVEREERQGVESSVWLNDQWKISRNVEISAGLRLNSFLSLGGSPYYLLDSSGDIIETLDYSSGQVVQSYLQLEPRFSANWRVTPTQSLKFGYSRSSQNVHALRNSSTMSMPFDRYAMSSNIIEPEVSDQVALGYIALTPSHDYEFTAEAYFKHIDNVYDYRDGTLFNSEIELERLILGGEGRSYGAEFSAKKSVGRFTGWVSYTLSWVESRIDGINGGQWYRASNDKRHDLSIVALYDMRGGWSASANFLYNTGQALTVPSAKYQIDGETYYYYPERNNYSTPDYHRLDVSFTHSKRKRNYTRQWSFGCYNLYNHYNPYMVYFQENESSATGSDAIQYSLFGIIPSVSFGITF
ncbi:MAG: TonB-dependent receptor [Rikenellaceae bacterium]